MWKPRPKSDDVMLRSLAELQVRSSRWTAHAGARLRKRYARPWDRGQTAVEYLGIIAVGVAIVVVLITSGLGNTILSKIRAQIAKIT